MCIYMFSFSPYSSLLLIILHFTDESVGYRITCNLFLDTRLLVSYNTVTRCMYSILIGHFDDVLDRIVPRLLIAKDYAFQPQLLPFIMADKCVTHIQSSVSNCWSDFKPIRRTLGCDEYFVLDEDLDDVPDITGMPRKLTAISQSIGDGTVWLKSTSQLIAFVSELAEKHDMLIPVDVAAEMRDRLRLMECSCNTIAEDSEALKESLQALVQMVK